MFVFRLFWLFLPNSAIDQFGVKCWEATSKPIAWNLVKPDTTSISFLSSEIEELPQSVECNNILPENRIS